MKLSNDLFAKSFLLTWLVIYKHPCVYHLAGQPSDADQVPIVATGDRLEQREDRIANGSWDLAIQAGGNPKPHETHEMFDTNREVA